MHWNIAKGVAIVIVVGIIAGVLAFLIGTVFWDSWEFALFG